MPRGPPRPRSSALREARESVRKAVDATKAAAERAFEGDEEMHWGKTLTAQHWARWRGRVQRLSCCGSCSMLRIAGLQTSVPMRLLPLGR
jgi:hypothetical protein